MSCLFLFGEMCLDYYYYWPYIFTHKALALQSRQSKVKSVGSSEQCFLFLYMYNFLKPLNNTHLSASSSRQSDNGTGFGIFLDRNIPDLSLVQLFLPSTLFNNFSSFSRKQNHVMWLDMIDYISAVFANKTFLVKEVFI